MANSLYEKLNKLSGAYIAKHSKKKLLLQLSLGFIGGVLAIILGVFCLIDKKIFEAVFLLPLGAALLFFGISIFVRRGININKPLIVLDKNIIYIFNKDGYIESTYKDCELIVKGKHTMDMNPYSLGDVKIKVDNKEIDFYDVESVYVLEKAYKKRNNETR